eukprot:scaffold106475_cov57-Phaeocystis_antarctica.AAC.2
MAASSSGVNPLAGCFFARWPLPSASRPRGGSNARASDAAAPHAALRWTPASRAGDRTRARSGLSSSPAACSLPPPTTSHSSCRLFQPL